MAEEYQRGDVSRSDLPGDLSVPADGALSERLANHIENKRNPATAAEVRATLWHVNQRLYQRIVDQAETIGLQRGILTGIVNAYDDGDTAQLAAAVTAAEKYIEETIIC